MGGGGGGGTFLWLFAYPGLTDGRERGGRGEANHGPCFPYMWKSQGEVTIHVLHAGLQMGMGGTIRLALLKSVCITGP